MRLGRLILGGAAGAAAGIAVWALIAYVAHVRSGWLAVPVGALVGVGVRYRNRPPAKPPEEENPFRRRRHKEEKETWEEQQAKVRQPAVAAVAVALIAAVLGKVLAVNLAVVGMKMESGTGHLTADNMIATKAAEIARDRQGKGRKLVWPAGKSPESATEQADFPAEVWQEAARWWGSLGTAEQEAKLTEEQKKIDAAANIVRTQRRATASASAYSVLDALWIVLATGAAFALNWDWKRKPKEEEEGEEPNRKRR